MLGDRRRVEFERLGDAGRRDASRHIEVTQIVRRLKDLTLAVGQRVQGVARATVVGDTLEELQSQLESGGSGGSVVINVTISPGGNQQSFVEGGTARVSAQSDNADISNLQIQYAGDTYSMNEEGTAAIPLVSTGAQELVFQYGDTTEKVAINVDAQASPTTGQADEARLPLHRPSAVIMMWYVKHYLELEEMGQVEKVPGGSPLKGWPGP